MGSPQASSAQESLRRYCILQAGHSNAAVMKSHGDFSDMFLKLLASTEKSKEEWSVFSVVDGQFPTEGLDMFDAVVITGSKFDAHGDDPWIVQLRQLLRETYTRSKVRMLGVCFGCQILAHSLWGESGRASCGFEMGTRILTLTAALHKLPCAKELPQKIHILEVHQDQVRKLPPGAQLLASSPNSPVEMFLLGNRVLAIQGHPEFSPDVVDSIITDLLKQGHISELDASRARETLQLKPDNDALRSFCLSFLRGVS